MREYQNLMNAARILQQAQTELHIEDGVLISPAWMIVQNAKNHVLEQAEKVLRG